jgi:methylmalonyl-CoA mutase, N-terminal domain
MRQSRPAADWAAAIDAVLTAARSETNLVPPVLRAVEARATVGEISDALRSVFGEHKEIDA